MKHSFILRRLAVLHRSLLYQSAQHHLRLPNSLAATGKVAMSTSVTSNFKVRMKRITGRSSSSQLEMSLFFTFILTKCRCNWRCQVACTTLFTLFYIPSPAELLLWPLANQLQWNIRHISLILCLCQSKASRPGPRFNFSKTSCPSLCWFIFRRNIRPLDPFPTGWYRYRKALHCEFINIDYSRRPWSWSNCTSRSCACAAKKSWRFWEERRNLRRYRRIWERTSIRTWVIGQKRSRKAGLRYRKKAKDTRRDGWRGHHTKSTLYLNQLRYRKKEY